MTAATHRAWGLINWALQADSEMMKSGPSILGALWRGHAQTWLADHPLSSAEAVTTRTDEP